MIERKNLTQGGIGQRPVRVTFIAVIQFGVLHKWLQRGDELARLAVGAVVSRAAAVEPSTTFREHLQQTPLVLEETIWLLVDVGHYLVQLLLRIIPFYIPV